MFTDVTMWEIYISFFSSRGYSFMFTNSAYEMSMGFSNIRGLTLSTRIFINYIRRHHKWNLIFKGKERANNIFINKDTSKVYLGKILINKKGKLFFTMIAVITNKWKRHINRQFWDRNCVPKLPVYMSLPFIGDHSYHCKKQLKTQCL